MNALSLWVVWTLAAQAPVETPAAPSSSPAVAAPAETPPPADAAPPASQPATAPDVQGQVAVGSLVVQGQTRLPNPEQTRARVLYAVRHSLMGGAVAVAVVQALVVLGAGLTLWFLPSAGNLDERLPAEWRHGVAAVFLFGVLPGSLGLVAFGATAALISAVRGWSDAFGASEP